MLHSLCRSDDSFLISSPCTFDHKVIDLLQALALHVFYTRTLGWMHVDMEKVERHREIKYQIPLHL
jgi:hypothetical protein